MVKHGMWLLVLASLGSCTNPNQLFENQSVGYTQGTTYQIKYLAQGKFDLQAHFDSIFVAIDQSMSTYKPNSIISRINRGELNVRLDQNFIMVLTRSLAIADETDAYFDPTVGPLVKAWGFSGSAPAPVTPDVDIDSLRSLIGFNHIRVLDTTMVLPPNFQIDFNAIAQGFTVDVVAEFLKSQGITNFMVEVGGEVRTSGVNAEDMDWVIGVDKPQSNIDEADRFQVILALKNESLATSGNYRKFWVDEVSGLKYAHTIDPHTGYPARNQLLSVSIIAKTAMDADAYATACMAMGLEKAFQFIKSKEGVEAYFVMSDVNEQWTIKMTPGFKERILNRNEDI